MDPAIWYESLDPRFARFVMFNAPLKRLATGFDWAEGPVWFGDQNCLLFSDIPNNRILRWSADTGLSTFRSPASFTNGHTRDGLGRLVSCEHGGRRVTRTDHDGKVTTIADHYQGKPLNSPNDVVVKSDGSIWFSDNGSGIRGNYLGDKAQAELPFRVYRLDPESGALTIAIGDMERPNGLCFSPNEDRLYVVDTPAGPRITRVYDMVDGMPANGRLLFDDTPGWADGIRCDTEGNVWCGMTGGPGYDGVAIFAPDGTLIGRILLPERCANLAFGGRKRNRLFMTASQSVYALYVEAQGCPWG